MFSVFSFGDLYLFSETTVHSFSNKSLMQKTKTKTKTTMQDQENDVEVGNNNLHFILLYLVKNNSERIKEQL